ncbi:MAG: ABC transporter substrate-binding protein, partial [Dehalococcoidales bacterium]|nr:ABC transporter substrate-binding protein [Dehalococcoidales bacterium]
MKKLIIPVVVILVLAFILTACGGGTSAPPSSTAPQTTVPVTSSPGTTTSPPTSTSPGSSSTPLSSPASKYGGTLRIIEVAAPGAPIGAEWEGNLGTYNTQQWCLERLLKEKLDGTMQPELAESWEVTSTGDSPNIVFHLRKGVKFHDGTDFNAKAVAWNLDIFKRTGMFTATTNFWKSWDIIDDYTIRVNFTSWRNTLLRAWENYFFVSPTAYEKNGIEWMRTHMVGTGPFMQTDYKRDVSMTAVRFKDYWDKGKPYLDGV